jgi:septum formation protein
MALWLAPQPLVLASKSDVRGKILAAAALRFEIRPANVDERAVEREAAPPDAASAAQLLARAKAQHVSATMLGRPVLGADQTLACGGERFTKPADRAAAAAQLRALRGRTHELHSALALVRDGALLFECMQTARLTMRNISDPFIENYLDMLGDAALSSVGAYQLEGIGVHLFERVEGDYFTILGLPLLPLLDFLRRQGFMVG